jgi:hypothetical protein
LKQVFLSFIQKIKTPKKWLIILTFIFTLIFSACAITLAIINSSNLVWQILSYASYMFAALFLSYSVYLIVIYAPKIKGKTVALVKKTTFGKRMLDQYGFRTIIFATCSLLINIAYVALHVVLAFITDAFYWYIFLAGYYAILVSLRSGIVLYHKRKGKEPVTSIDREKIEIRKYRSCGVILTLIPFTLSVPIAQIIKLDRAFIHAGHAIFAFAAYSFYKIVMSIINVVKSKKQTDVTIQAVRYIGLADALVSIFALQTAMFHEFSKGSGYAFANILTGSVVCVLTVALGINMIISSSKKSKQQ